MNTFHSFFKTVLWTILSLSKQGTRILQLIDRFREKYLLLKKWRLRKHCFKNEWILVRTLQDIALQIQCAAVKTIFSLRIEPPHTLISFLSLIIFKNTNQGRLVTFFCIWLFWSLSNTDTFDQSYRNSTIHSPPWMHMARISKEV